MGGWQTFGCNGEVDKEMKNGEGKNAGGLESSSLCRHNSDLDTIKLSALELPDLSWFFPLQLPTHRYEH